MGSLLFGVAATDTATYVVMLMELV